MPARATAVKPVRVITPEPTEMPLQPQVLAAAPAPSPRLRRDFTLGWLPDVPDYRDHTVESPEVTRLFRAGTPLRTAAPAPRVDLRKFCSPIEDQQDLGSCTAQAVAGLVEYFENRAAGAYLDASRLFLYKVTRKLYRFEGDTGAYIRGTIKALKIFGVCPEDYWPYATKEFDKEPTPFCYAFAQAYKAITYYRLWDPDPSKLVDQLRGSLSNQLPFAFGFSVYSSIWNPEVQRTGDIPVPKKGEHLEGGHAIMAVGYDDDARRFLIRNSWGPNWGDQGYGTLPYEYVEKGMADDFWVLVNSDYVPLLGL